MVKKLYKILLALLLVILLSIWVAIARAPSDKNLHLSVLNVGQGDSILIQTPEHQNILVDGGPDNSVLDELGKKIPFYSRTIDAVVLTHPHADHLFGLIEVLKRYQVKKVYLTGVVQTTNEYLEFLRTIKEKNVPAQDVKAGDSLDFGELKMKVLWPIDDLEGKTIDNLNNSSIVLAVSYHAFTALLLGDLENDSQNLMMKSSSLGHYNLVKIAHHGSSNGFNENLLSQIKPEVAAISVGADNKYGHPALSTILGLEKLGIKTYRTDRDGTLEFLSDGEKMWIK